MGWGKAADLEGAGLRYSLFFFALMMGAGVFNLFAHVFRRNPQFCLLYAFARWAARTDPPAQFQNGKVLRKVTLFGYCWDLVFFPTAQLAEKLCINKMCLIGLTGLHSLISMC